jgi:hypothetical protein
MNAKAMGNNFGLPEWGYEQHKRAIHSAGEYARDAVLLAIGLH